MPAIRSQPALLATLALLASCSAPPKPPAVDDAHRRPVNAAASVELQVCKGELQQSRIHAGEAQRLAAAASASLAGAGARLAALRPGPRGAEPNLVFTVRFAHAGTAVAVSPGLLRQLLEAARGAPLVMLRGRTDGPRDTPAESRIARERAAAVRDLLVASGIDPGRIRATYQPAGDPVADNADAGGRALNRRVEIEVYRVLPLSAVASDAAD